MKEIDWSKPGWIMVAMWLIGGIIIGIFSAWYAAIPYIFIAGIRAWMVYNDPRGL